MPAKRCRRLPRPGHRSRSHRSWRIALWLPRLRARLGLLFPVDFLVRERCLRWTTIQDWLSPDQTILQTGIPAQQRLWAPFLVKMVLLLVALMNPLGSFVLIWSGCFFCP